MAASEWKRKCQIGSDDVFFQDFDALLAAAQQYNLLLIPVYRERHNFTFHLTA
jgi:hypothetical protein